MFAYFDNAISVCRYGHFQLLRKVYIAKSTLLLDEAMSVFEHFGCRAAVVTTDYLGKPEKVCSNSVSMVDR